MGRLLTEQKVLRKLNIDNFRQLTKDKVITMASMLDKMDPEVAKKALEQFPHFSKTVEEVLSEYKEILDEGLKSNSKSIESYYETCNGIIKALEKQLENEDLSFGERKYIIEKMLEVSKMMGEKDSENKKFIAIMSGLGLVAVGILIAGLSSVLGGNTNIETNDYSEENI
ncbi:MAG: hypothetical protein WBI74_02670 [Caldicoprobacterales bacterium]